MKFVNSYRKTITSVAFSGDGKYLATGEVSLFKIDATQLIELLSAFKHLNMKYVSKNAVYQYTCITNTVNS